MASYYGGLLTGCGVSDTCYTNRPGSAELRPIRAVRLAVHAISVPLQRRGIRDVASISIGAPRLKALLNLAKPQPGTQA